YVSAHFGRCPSFTIVDIIEGKVVDKQIINNPGHHPGFLPQFFHEKGVECIIAGGMGMNAQNLFNQYNIEQIVGISGKIDEVIRQFSNGTLIGGETLCKPGAGKGYGIDKSECDHGNDHHNHGGEK
ncbi:MAG: NifB/NifX family molybdenum-iron cluster-binding protein, partial [Spirochaetes bacterium]|nr:NifB/NifX family molybdenum-iron cluster-binding protein [Spirochaetota bacterium]